MKKFGINIQLFLRSTVRFADFQNFTSLFIFPNINQQLFIACLNYKEDTTYRNDDDIPDFINKKENQSFQLPK